ncbi:MAG: helix-turn-helix transcriptional regulator [Bacteroidota bacterium]
MSVVSENIKYLRRVNGLTQEQFSRRVGIKRSLLGAYEEGRANPNLDNLMNIAKIFGTSVDNLLKNDIRKLRENQSVPLPQPSPQLLAPSDEPVAKDAKLPKPVASIIEKYYQEEASRQGNHIKLVAQKVALKRVTPLAAERPLQTALQSTEMLPAHYNGTARMSSVFNKAYTTENLPTEHKTVASNPPIAKSVAEKPAQTIEVVRQAQVADYILHHANYDYLQKLPVFHLPVLPAGNYRAFEVGDDFAFPGSLVVGKRVNDWYNLVDGQHYLVLLHQKGILYRRVYSQVKIKGSLLLSSDKATIPSVEIPAKEVMEIWEAKAFISTQLPEPAISLNRLTQLVSDLQQELNQLTINSHQ